MKFKPLQDWAVIQRTDADERTAGGIIIPDSAKEKPAEGIVVAIGPGKYETEKEKDKEMKKKKFVPTTLKPGQKVIFAKYMVTEIEIDDEEIALVREDDILGTVEGTGALTVRKDYAVKEKPAQPVVIKKKAEIAPVTAPKKLAKKKAAPKKAKAAKKPASKSKKKAATKKKAKKAAVKKTAVKKKAAKKVTKKTARKKTVKKKTTKKAAKKKAAKKTKKAASKKRKKTKKRK
ncbi:MAG: co-chaperone GroES [Thermodesulfovibrionales bacterium]